MPPKKPLFTESSFILSGFDSYTDIEGERYRHGVGVVKGLGRVISCWLSAFRSATMDGWHWAS